MPPFYSSLPALRLSLSTATKIGHNQIICRHTTLWVTVLVYKQWLWSVVHCIGVATRYLYEKAIGGRGGGGGWSKRGRRKGSGRGVQLGTLLIWQESKALNALAARWYFGHVVLCNLNYGTYQNCLSQVAILERTRIVQFRHVFFQNCYYNSRMYQNCLWIIFLSLAQWRSKFQVLSTLPLIDFWYVLELQNYLNNSGTYQNWGRKVQHDRYFCIPLQMQSQSYEFIICDVILYLYILETPWYELCICAITTGTGTYPGNHQGVISTPKHKIFGKMTPSCILQDFLYLFESKEIFQKFHS